MIFRIKKAVKAGFLHLLSANFLSQSLGFLSLLVVSKILAAEEVGAIKIIQSYLAIGQTIACVGIPSAIIKYCAEDSEPEERQYIFQKGLLISGAASLVMVVLLALFAHLNLISQDEIVVKWLPLYALTIIPNVCFSVGLVYLQAIKSFKRMAKVQSMMKVVAVVFICCATYLLGMPGYIWINIATMAVSALIVIRYIRIKHMSGKDYSLPIGFFFLSRMSLYASVVMVVGNYVDMILLDHFIDDRALVGYYALATIFIMIGTQFVASVQSFLTPYFSEKAHDRSWVWKEMIRCQRYLSLTMLPVCGGIYLVAMMLVRYYYGAEYVFVLTVLSGLLIQLWLHTTYSILGCTLLAINKVQYNLVTAIAYLCIKFSLAYFFIVHYGIMGLIYAQLIAEIPIIALEYILAYKVLHEPMTV